MRNAGLPEESLAELELELGRRAAVAGAFQLVAFALLVWFLTSTGPLPAGAAWAGAVVVVAMLGRILLYGYQRGHVRTPAARRRWRLVFRSFFCLGGAAWGVLAAGTLVTDGVTFPFLIAILINIGVAALSVQNVGLDLLLVRAFLPLILGPPLVVAVMDAREPQHTAIAVLLSLFLAYQLLLSRKAHTMFIEALVNRNLVQAQSSQLAALIEAMPGYVAWTDLEGRVIGTNERLASSLSGAPPAAVTALARSFVASGAEQWVDEQQLSLVGAPRWYLVAARRYRTSDGERVVLSALDVEAGKEAERQLEAVRARAFDSARLEALGTMAGGIAHEINNPLQVLRNVGTMLRAQLDHGDRLDARSAQLLGMLDRTVDRMATIVAGLRNFARHGQGDPVERCEVAALVREVVELVSTSRPLTPTRLEVLVPPGLSIECRRTEIGQVLLNLLNNAYDATEALEQPWIEIRAVDRGDDVELWVTDSGAGIAPELTPKIMLPFFTTKTGKGTGLGLSISRSIVERHRGALRVDEHSANTRFVVTLPKRSRDAAARSYV